MHHIYIYIHKIIDVSTSSIYVHIIYVLKESFPSVKDLLEAGWSHETTCAQDPEKRIRHHRYIFIIYLYIYIHMINLRTNHILHTKVVVWKRYRLTESSVPGRWEAQRSRCMGAMPSLQVEGFLVFAASVSHTWWYPKLAKLVYNLQKMQKLGI